MFHSLKMTMFIISIEILFSKNLLELLKKLKVYADVDHQIQESDFLFYNIK